MRDIADTTCVIYFVTLNVTFNLFQNFVFTYFKQERQCLWNYCLLTFQTSFGYNKAKDKH